MRLTHWWRGIFIKILLRKKSTFFKRNSHEILPHFSPHFWGHFCPWFSSTFPPLFPHFSPNFFKKNHRKFQENFTEKMARKVPSEAGKPGIPLFDYKIPQFLFLYINPYDTPDILKKMQKSALFSIPFHENFLIGLIFRSKPRCKKIVNGGGVVQVGRKRAPQGTFHRNFTPPHERRGLNRTRFVLQWGAFFCMSKKLQEISGEISWKFHDFSRKKSSTGRIFFKDFLTFEEAISRPFFRSFFRVILGVFFRGFF